MKLKKFICLYIYLVLCCGCVWGQSTTDRTIEALSLLTFHTNEWLTHCSPSLDEEQDLILLTPQERKAWWERTASLLYQGTGRTQEWREINFHRAYLAYQEAEIDVIEGALEEAQEALTQAYNLLILLRDDVIDQEAANEKDNEFFSLYDLKSPLDELDVNRSIKSTIKQRMSPYVISSSHPMRPVLDALFKTSRVTKNAITFQEAGFITLSARPRSFVLVARHPLLPGYLMKAYLDTELRKKQRTESWEWLVKRCEGAAKVRDVIRKRKIKHFVVADKYLYPLPQNPSPPIGTRYTRHLAALLVTDMDLAPDEVNLHVWSNLITPEQLNELYDIVTYAKGSSYRPDNISYTNKGQFAFIDTEYPSRGPDYRSIRPFLNSSMRKYWDKLVKSGR
jgi:hypothetical protein